MNILMVRCTGEDARWKEEAALKKIRKVLERNEETNKLRVKVYFKLKMRGHKFASGLVLQTGYFVDFLPK